METKSWSPVPEVKVRFRSPEVTRPHQRPVAESTTTMTAIQTASNRRITSDDFRCRRSQFTVVLPYDQQASGIPYGNPRC